MFFRKKQAKIEERRNRAVALCMAKKMEQPVFFGDHDQALYLVGNDEVWLDEKMVNAYKNYTYSYSSEKVKDYELKLISLGDPVVESINEQSGETEWYYVLPTTGEPRMFLKSEVETMRGYLKGLTFDALKTIKRDMNLTSCALENALLVLDGNLNDKNAIGTYADEFGKFHQFPVYAVEERRIELGKENPELLESEI